jgi:heterodisulfide reductase subunit A-like polyferredoxin
MKSERFWVLVLVVTTFCAGLAAGVLLAATGRVPSLVREERPFGGYEQRMTEAFDLDEEQVRNLRWILHDYQEKIEALKESNIAALDGELVKIGRWHREKIREMVVPEHHRQEFDLWVGGLPVLPTSSKLQ